MYRKGVSALITNEKNEFLLVNLVSFEEKYFAIPGGGVEQEETLKDAVYRELDEELGIKKEHLQIVGQSNVPVRFKFKEIKMNRDGINYEGSERYFFGFKFKGKDEEIRLAMTTGTTTPKNATNFLKPVLCTNAFLQTTNTKVLTHN